MKKIICFAVFALVSNKGISQDQILLNPNQALIATNPSFAGSNGTFRNQFFYRNQWPNLSGNNTSFYNSIDANVKKLHGGIAVSAMINDMAHGTYRNSEINLVYAPIFECKESGLKIIPSIQLTALKREVDIGSLTFQQWGGRPWTTVPSGKKTNLDASAGLLVNYKNFYAGGTIFHLNQPDVGLFGTSKLPTRFSFNVSYNIPLNEKTLLNFSSVFNSQNKFNSLQLAANAIFMKHLVIGLGYVSNDLAYLNVGYRNNYFSVNLGYDVVLSRLAGKAQDGYRLALGLSLHKKTENTTLKNFENW
jgi:type IX secretion system PorP/SprF family membrane protein